MVDQQTKAPETRFVSVGTKLAVVIVALLTVVSIGLSLKLVERERKSLINAKKQAASMVADYLGEALVAPLDFGDKDSIENALAFLRKNQDIVYAVVEPLDAKLPTIELYPGAGASASLADQSATDATTVVDDRVIARRMIKNPQSARLGSAIVHFTLASERLAYEEARRRILIASFVLTVAIGGLLIAITRHLVVSPLDKLVAAARNLKEGAGARVRVTANDELGRLGHAFNAMAEAIADREQRLKHRNQAMRMVLDNVDQALVTVRRDGTMESERSAAFERLFGAPLENEDFAQRIAGHDPNTRAFLRLGWEAATEDYMPLALILDQMPKSMDRDGRHLTLGLKPIEVEGEFAGALMMISDVTAAVEAMREQEKQREFVRVFERAMHDRLALVEFVTETGKLVDAVVERKVTNIDEVMRYVHTVKGNSAHWDVTSVAKIAHELESFIVQERALPSDERVNALRASWTAFTTRVTRLVSAPAVARVEVNREDLEALLTKVRDRSSHDDLERAIDRLRHEPTTMRFERVKDQAEGLARRLGKPSPTVIVDANNIRLPASRFAPFWQSLIHVVRNAMDHGIEAPAVRESAGKPPQGTLTLRSRVTASEFIIEVGDDGAGIDWSRVRQKAAAANLPAATQAELENALFADGFSTAERVTDVSGRGVGLGAARIECQKLEGHIEIVTELGKGTTWSFRFPRQANEVSLFPPSSTAS